MKPITAIVPDFRDALEEAMKETSEQIVYELKREGPYWTGFFETLWVIEPGKKAIPGTIPNPFPVPKRPKTPQYTEAFAPDSPNLGGYTIGNRAQYKLYAQYILADTSGRGAQQGRSPNATAEKFWFDTYVNAKMGRTINREIANVFRRYR